MAKIIKSTKIEASIVVSLNPLPFSCETQSAEGELLRANIKHQNNNITIKYIKFSFTVRRKQFTD
jgi:hypothetical protein